MPTTAQKTRLMTRAELDTAVAWAAQEGWNPGLHDADVFWKTDPQGFVALESDGEMIGSGSTVSYDGQFGFMGFYIVKPELRGQGIGRDLCFALRDILAVRLKPGAAIGIDGVFNMQPFYSKGGFKFSHRNLRMEGRGQKLDFESKNIHKITGVDFQSVAKLDQECFGVQRKVFMNGWLDMEDSYAVSYTVDGESQGFGLARKCINGWKFGPLFAETAEVADQIFRALNTVAIDQPIFLDVPENNASALELSSKYGMKECFGCARMYYGETPALPWKKIFGVTTFELG